MAPDPIGLGRIGALGGVQGKPTGAPRASHSGGLGTLDFAALVGMARRGEVRSGLEVTVSPGVGVELRADQLAQLSEAADLAQSRGVQVAAVLLDDTSVVLDVGTRRVVGLLPGGEAGGAGQAVRTDVDGVVDLRSVAARDGSALRAMLQGGVSTKDEDSESGDARSPGPLVDQSSTLWRRLSMSARI